MRMHADNTGIEVSNLRRALRGITDNPCIIFLLLESLDGEIFHEKVEEIAGEDTNETLLEAESLRLIIPEGNDLSWKDGRRFFGGKYRIPNVVRFAVKRACETGLWDGTYAIKAYFKEIKEDLSELMPLVFDEIRKKAYSGKISATEIKKIVSSFNIAEAGVLIAELKGAGLISPLIEPGMSDACYEIHPLF
ncbi:MAG: hypothetical protein ACXQTD_04750 [Candidatus Syntropharchaeia archaeon]